MDERRQQQDRPQREGGSFPRRDDRGTGQRGPSPAIIKFKETIRAKGFTDDEVMNQSETLAQSFIAHGGPDKEKENSLTQIRKFYNQVKVVQGKAAQADFNAVKPQVRLLQAQAAYSVARKLLTDDFKEFFDAAAHKIIGEGRDSLNAFAELFQAVYAYYYYHMKR